MKEFCMQIGRAALFYAALLLLFALERLAFCLGYGIEWWGPQIHGLAIDCSVAAYFTMPVLLLMAVAAFAGEGGWLRSVLTAWCAVTALLLGAIFTLDLALYEHWEFRLDTTPIFYFLSSPSSAMASVTASEGCLGALSLLIWAIAGFFLLRMALLWRGRPVPRSKWCGIGIVVIATALVIPIRGGVTVSTMNLSRAYYSREMKLNHAAVNPAFSLMYSATHDSDFDSQFRFFDPEEAERIFLYSAKPMADAEEPLQLSAHRPDVYIIILESFSNALMPSLGGDSVAVRLDSIASKGVLWDRFYATGFRTDRAIPAILSALPSQPTVSLMKHVEKAEHLPSLAAEMTRRGGYDTQYIYGGDANFTNMLAYLVSAGYQTIVSDKDFPIKKRLSKWGAHDDVLFEKVLTMLPGKDDAPHLTVVQTSSSHEPFEVPYASPRFADKPRRNAFAFTDSVVGNFLNELQRRSAGRPYLAVLVPDHYGAWPLREGIHNIEGRHAVPLILTGTALPAEYAGQRRHDPASQPDIAPTLLALLGMDGSKFIFGNNLADPQAPRRAWMADPDAVALMDENGNILTLDIRNEDAAADPRVRAYLQMLYRYIGSL